MTNVWIGGGRLARDPSLRYGESGTAVVPMRLAVPRADADADFLDVVAFGALAEACAAHLTKGRHILVEGALRQHEWVDADTGKRRSRVEVVANRVKFLDAPRPDIANPDDAA